MRSGERENPENREKETTDKRAGWGEREIKPDR